MRFYAGFVTCALMLAVIAWLPGLRVEWTRERRAIFIHGRVVIEVLPSASRTLAGYYADTP